MADPKRIDVTVVPAQPGYMLLWRSMVEDSECEVTVESMDPTWFSTIVGWRVDTFMRPNGDVYSFVEALTHEDSVEAPYAIIRPDGVVEVPHEITLPNLAAYIKHVKGDLNG